MFTHKKQSIGIQSVQCYPSQYEHYFSSLDFRVPSWSFLFLATLVDNVRMTCSVSLPDPPYTLKTKGLQLPCSSWMTR